jgi:hypothetical protein
MPVDAFPVVLAVAAVEEQVMDLVKDYTVLLAVEADAGLLVE